MTHPIPEEKILLSNYLSFESESKIYERNFTHDENNFCKLILYVELSDSRFVLKNDSI